MESNTKHGEATSRGQGIYSNVFSLMYQKSHTVCCAGSKEVVAEKSH